MAKPRLDVHFTPRPRRFHGGDEGAVGCLADAAAGHHAHARAPLCHDRGAEQLPQHRRQVRSPRREVGGACGKVDARAPHARTPPAHAARALEHHDVGRHPLAQRARARRARHAGADDAHAGAVAAWGGVRRDGRRQPLDKVVGDRGGVRGDRPTPAEDEPKVNRFVALLHFRVRHLHSPPLLRQALHRLAPLRSAPKVRTRSEHPGPADRTRVPGARGHTASASCSPDFSPIQR